VEHTNNDENVRLQSERYTTKSQPEWAKVHQIYLFIFILFKHFVAYSTQEISIHIKTQYE